MIQTELPKIVFWQQLREKKRDKGKEIPLNSGPWDKTQKED